MDPLILRLPDPDTGIVREIEITGEQALDLAAGKPIAHVVNEQPVGVNEDGELILRDSAIPEPPDAG